MRYHSSMSHSPTLDCTQLRQPFHNSSFHLSMVNTTNLAIDNMLSASVNTTSIRMKVHTDESEGTLAASQSHPLLHQVR